MKICVAQTRSVKGDTRRNIDNHKKIIDLAVSNGAGVIIFPELSLTGYEPGLAKELATTPGDPRFDDFQKISDHKQITIGVGMPVKSNTSILISMIIFQPRTARQTYSKQYLHPDEYPYFINGQGQVFLMENREKIALAICYELSVPEHAANAHKNEAQIYVASVAKTAEGVKKAIATLSGIASKYAMTVLMANCIGECDGDECGGKSSAWNKQGLLLGQLNDKEEGILIIDTGTGELVEKNISQPDQ